jgi:DNA-directed RNA polymerase subunit F
MLHKKEKPQRIKKSAFNFSQSSKHDNKNSYQYGSRFQNLDSKIQLSKVVEELSKIATIALLTQTVKALKP